MIPYWAILRVRFQGLLQYRAAAWAGFGTQLFFGLILVYVLEAFYRVRPHGQPLDLPQAATYVWLGQAMLAMLPWNLDPDVKALIRSGNVAYELLRPMDLYTMWYARSVALRTAPTLLRSVPLFAVAMLFLGMLPPASPVSAAAWLVATAGALCLGCAITQLMNISMLWTVSGDGIASLVAAAVTLLSGTLLPLPLFPVWVQKALAMMPFSGLVDGPFRLYLGRIPPSGLGAVLLHQAVWTVALVLAGRMLLGRALRRVEVQGG